MTTLLNVQSSPNLQGSASRALSAAFVERFRVENPDAKVIDLDLALSPPDHVGPAHLAGFFATEPVEDPAAKAALAASDAYVDQLVAADVVVLGTPMHNFGVASTMKAWIDNILRVGRTFNYTETGPVGLLSGKKVVIAVGSGGVYSDGPMTGMEHCGRYLRDILAIIGLTDVSILRAEGLAYGPEAAEAAIAKGVAEAEALAA